MNAATSIFIFSLICLTSCGQAPVAIPEGFVETKPPKPGSSEWYTLNHSAHDFAVKITDGKLEIEKATETQTCELHISNGKLIGINKGEWGGKLSFEPADSTKSKVDIKRGNIKFIFNFKDKIYFIEGLAHLSSSSGALFELDTTGHTFTYRKLVDFEDAPEAFTIYQDKILIATHQGFYVVKDFEKELVFQNTFWHSLYPNSMAVLDDHNVFIGMRSGIVKLDLRSKTLKFYKYDK